MGGIVFAVGTREYRNDYARLRERFAANQRKLFRPADLLDLFAFTTIREYGFDAAFPSFLQLRHANGFAACRKLVGFGGAAKFGNGYQIGIGRNLSILGELDDEAAISQAEQVVRLNFIGKLYAYAIANAHLEQSLSSTAVAQGCRSGDLAFADKRFNQAECGIHAVRFGNQGFHIVERRRDADDARPSALELRGNHAVDRAGGNSKTYERRRHVDFGIALFEAARHGVFAADGANAQIDLSHQSAQNGSGGLAPTLGDVT